MNSIKLRSWPWWQQQRQPWLRPFLPWLRHHISHRWSLRLSIAKSKKLRAKLVYRRLRCSWTLEIFFPSRSCSPQQSNSTNLHLFHVLLSIQLMWKTFFSQQSNHHSPQTFQDHSYQLFLIIRSFSSNLTAPLMR